MNKSISLLLASLFYTCIAFAQDDPMSILFEANKIMPIVEDVDYVESTEYVTFNMDEEALPDSLIINGEDTVKLYFYASSKISYPKARTTVTESFEADGKLKSTETMIQNEEGRVISYGLEYTDPKMAAFMNSTKNYDYDDQNRLTRITQGDVEFLSLSYTNNDLPDKMVIDIGMGKMVMMGEPYQDSIRYNFSMEASVAEDEEEAGFMAMMAEKLKNGPKEYINYKNVGGQHHYVSYKEDKETKEPIKQAFYVRSSDGNLIEEMSSAYHSHNTFKYNSKGELLERTNVKTGEATQNEFDENGNLTVQNEEYEVLKNTYDQNNKIIKITKHNKFDNSIKGLTINNIKYR